jgi:hypothetical protein
VHVCLCVACSCGPLIGSWSCSYIGVVTEKWISNGEMLRLWVSTSSATILCVILNHLCLICFNSYQLHYRTPGATLSENACNGKVHACLHYCPSFIIDTIIECASFVTSVCLGSDLVCRLSAKNIVEMRAEVMIRINWMCSNSLTLLFVYFTVFLGKGFIQYTPLSSQQNGINANSYVQGNFLDSCITCMH